MAGRFMNARFRGVCNTCGRAVMRGDRIYSNGAIRCEPCGAALIALARSEGPCTTTTPDAIVAAQSIYCEAPAHLRESLAELRGALHRLTFLRCPREAVAAAVLLGRESGAREAEAAERADVAGQVAATLDALPVADLPLPDLDPAPSGPGISLDVLDGLGLSFTVPGTATTIATTLADPAMLAAETKQAPAPPRFVRVAPPAKAPRGPATRAAKGGLPWA